MQDINLTDILLFVGVSQGFFLATSLQLLPNKNQSANRVLSLALMVAVLMLFGRIAVFRLDYKWIYDIAVLADTTIYLFGPLIYTYCRRLLYKESPDFRPSWHHFIPAIAHLAYWIWFMIIGLEQFAVYNKAGIRLLFKFHNREKKEMAIDQAVFSYLRLLLTSLAMMSLFWAISIFNVYMSKQSHPIFNYTLMWIITPFFIYIIGYYSFRQPEIFRLSLQEDKKQEKDRLKPNEIHQLQKRLDYYMSEEQVYLDASLTLKLLAENKSDIHYWPWLLM